MNINNINPYQGLQNAIRPGGSNTSGVENKLILPSGRTNAVFMADEESLDPQRLKVTERINTLQRNLDLTLVSFPPFFPIATYQRADLITEMQGIGQDIQKADIDPSLKQSVATMNELSAESTDADIADALDNLIIVRDALVKQRVASQQDVRPGSILTLEI